MSSLKDKEPEIFHLRSILQILGYSIINLNNNDDLINATLEKTEEYNSLQSALKESMIELIFDKGRGVPFSIIEKISAQNELTFEKFLEILQIFLNIIGLDLSVINEDKIIFLLVN